MNWVTCLKNDTHKIWFELWSKFLAAKIKPNIWSFLGSLMFSTTLVTPLSPHKNIKLQPSQLDVLKNMSTGQSAPSPKSQDSPHSARSKALLLSSWNYHTNSCHGSKHLDNPRWVVDPKKLAVSVPAIMECESNLKIYLQTTACLKKNVGHIISERQTGRERSREWMVRWYLGEPTSKHLCICSDS